MADWALELAIHEADIRLHNSLDLKLERSDKDSNGIFQTLEWKRQDNTLAKKSVLSGGPAPQYTQRVETYYAANGTTIITTRTYILAWDDDELVSEV